MRYTLSPRFAGIEALLALRGEPERNHVQLKNFVLALDRSIHIRSLDLHDDVYPFS